MHLRVTHMLQSSACFHFLLPLLCIFFMCFYNQVGAAFQRTESVFQFNSCADQHRSSVFIFMIISSYKLILSRRGSYQHLGPYAIVTLSYLWNLNYYKSRSIKFIKHNWIWSWRPYIIHFINIDNNCRFLRFYVAFFSSSLPMYSTPKYITGLQASQSHLPAAPAGFLQLMGTELRCTYQSILPLTHFFADCVSTSALPSIWYYQLHNTIAYAVA